MAVATVAVLIMSAGLVRAQESVRILGNHTSSTSFATELPAHQPLQLEVILALNNRAQLTRLETDLQDRHSPVYHQWLTPAQFAARFGPTAQQMQAVANWLDSQGLLVTAMDPLARTVRFTGLYSEVKQALRTTILGDGANHFNVTDPQVPAELAPIIVSIEGLNSHDGGSVQSDAVVSTCTQPSGCNGAPYFGPGDFYTFYDETPVLGAGNLGTGGSATSGDCIAMLENGSVNTQALTNFTSQFQGLPSPLPSPGVLPPIVYTAINPPVNGATPTATPGLPGDNEPYLDIEWAHAVSPNTPIRVYYASGGGYLNAMQYAVLDNRCGAISSSIEGGCEPVTTLLALDDVEAQAVVQGQTIFKSSGDYGSNWLCGSPIPAILSQNSPQQQAYNQSGCAGTSSNYADANGNLYQPSIDEQAASPNITTVGGTKFQAAYDSAGNDLSTVGQNLESAWNNNNDSSPVFCPTKDASGGGPSVIFAKPAWQTGIGVPNDGARDIPDVALGADGPLVGVTTPVALPGFFVATQKTTDPAPTFALTGGTSIATPMWAGISRLIAQAQGVTRLGNINARLYELGNLQSSASGLHDVTVGNNIDNGIPGYSAGVGYDLVTGWGSADIAKLVAAFPGAAASSTPIATTVSAGAIAAAGNFTVTNTTGGALALQSVTVNLSSPALFSALTLSATVGATATQAATAVPSASSLFTFAQPVIIPPGGLAAFTLKGTAATQPPIGAAGVITAGAGGPPWGGGPWLGLLLFLASVCVIAPRRRRPLALAGLLLLGGLATLSTSCGGSSGSGNAPITTQSSKQSIAAGGIVVGDNQGGLIQVSNLPAALGSVTVEF